MATDSSKKCIPSEEITIIGDHHESVGTLRRASVPLGWIIMLNGVSWLMMDPDHSWLKDEAKEIPSDPGNDGHTLVSPGGTFKLRVPPTT